MLKKMRVKGHVILVQTNITETSGQRILTIGRMAGVVPSERHLSRPLRLMPTFT